MSCLSCEALIYPYLDGELVDDERLSVESHLTACAACAHRFDVEQRTLTLLKTRARQAAPLAPLTLHASLAAQLQRVERDERRRRVYGLSAAAAGFAVAAAVGHAGWQSWQRQLDSDEVARRHARQLPLEVQGQPEAVEAWFGGKLEHRVAVPRFPNATTAGARLANVRDRDAAYIRYQPVNAEAVPRHDFGLFVSGASAGDFGDGPELHTSHGYTVMRWREGDLVYQLVTDLDEGDVRQLVPPPRFHAQPASLETVRSPRQFVDPPGSHR